MKTATVHSLFGELSLVGRVAEFPMRSGTLSKLDET